MSNTLETVLRVISLNTQISELSGHPELQDNPIVKYNLNLASAAFTLTIEQIKTDLVENCFEFVDFENINVSYTIKDGEKILYDESSCISEKCKQVIEQSVFENNYNQGGNESDAVSDIDDDIEHPDSAQNNTLENDDGGDLHNKSSVEDCGIVNLTDDKDLLHDLQVDEGAPDQQSIIDDEPHDTHNNAVIGVPTEEEVLNVVPKEECVSNDTLQVDVICDEPKNVLPQDDDTGENTNQNDTPNDTWDKVPPTNAVLDDDAIRSTLDSISEVALNNSYSPMIKHVIEANEIKAECSEVVDDNRVEYDEVVEGISLLEAVVTSAENNEENTDPGESHSVKRSFDDSTSTNESQRKRTKIVNEKESDNGTTSQRVTLPDGWTKEQIGEVNTGHYKYISPEGDVYNCGIKIAIGLYKLKNSLPEGWTKIEQISKSKDKMDTVYKAPDGSLFLSLTKVFDFIQKNKTSMNETPDKPKKQKNSFSSKPMNFACHVKMWKKKKTREPASQTKIQNNLSQSDAKLPEGWTKEKWNKDHYKYKSPEGDIYQCGLKQALKLHEQKAKTKKAKKKFKHKLFSEKRVHHLF